MRHISCSRVVSIGLVVLAAINAPALAEPFQHKFGELREYHKHWLAVCPNRHVPSEMMSYGSTCWASTYTGTDGFFLDDRLSVARNRTTGAIGITFVNNDTLDKSQPVNLRFSNGSPVLFSFGSQIEINGNVINEYRFVKSQDIEKLVAGMKSANRLTITLPTTNGSRRFTYSMIGFTAALNFLENHAR